MTAAAFRQIVGLGILTTLWAAPALVPFAFWWIGTVPTAARQS